MSEELEGQMALFSTEMQGLSTRYSRTFDVYVPWQEADQSQLCNMTHLVADVHS